MAEIPCSEPFGAGVISVSQHIILMIKTPCGTAFVYLILPGIGGRRGSESGHTVPLEEDKSDVLGRFY